MGTTASPWSENAVHRLRQLVEQAFSADAAAAALSTETGHTFTRDSVKTKARGLGLTLQGRAGRREGSTDSHSDAAMWKAGGRNLPRVKEERAGQGWRSQGCGYDRHPIPLPVDELRYIPPAKPRPFLDRPDSGCAWPAGGWLDRGTIHTQFCCETIEPGRPYCRDHARIAYEAVAA